MGAVYRAEDPRLGRTVAIKVLSSDRVGDTQRRARFLQAARRLVERGARTALGQAAALGPQARVEEHFGADQPPPPDEVIKAFWWAARAGGVSSRPWRRPQLGRLRRTHPDGRRASKRRRRAGRVAAQ